jgi:hypothetical protein
MRAAVSVAWRYCSCAITAAESAYPAFSSQYLAHMSYYSTFLHPLATCRTTDLRTLRRLTAGSGCHRRQYAQLAENCSSRVTLENRETGRVVHVLGVAHASEKSAESVRAFIQELQPQVVVLPLCTMRYLAMSQNKPLLPDEVLVRAVHLMYS